VLSTADLEAMQTTVNESLPDACALVVDTLASDSAGGQTATPGSPVDVACRISPMPVTRRSTDAEVLQTGRIVSQAPWLIALPAGTTIDTRYRITSGGRAFEVVEVLAARSWELSVQVACRLVNGGAG